MFCDCWFHVDRAGLVQFPDDSDGSPVGRGTDTLVLRGYRVSLDGRRLSNRLFAMKEGVA